MSGPSVFIVSIDHVSKRCLCAITNLDFDYFFSLAYGGEQGSPATIGRARHLNLEVSKVSFYCMQTKQNEATSSISQAHVLFGVNGSNWNSEIGQNAVQAPV